MNLIKVDCVKCGAKLNLPVDKRLVTCQFCAAELIIKSEDEKPPVAPVDISDEEAAELLLQLEDLNHRWKKTCDQFRVTTTSDESFKMSQSESMMLGTIGPAIGIAWIFGIEALGVSHPVFIAFGIVFIIVTLHASLTFANQKSTFQKLRQEYLYKRLQLESLLSGHRLSQQLEKRKSSKTESSGTVSQDPAERDEDHVMGGLSWSI